MLMNFKEKNLIENFIKELIDKIYRFGTTIR